MTKDRSSSRLRYEADQKNRLAQRLDPAESFVAKDDRVRTQPIAEYQLPHFVSKTANADEVATLRELHQELWELNEQNVGERMIDVAAYASCTGEKQAFERRVMRWFEFYLGHRIRHKLDDHSRGADVFGRSGELLNECAGIIDPLVNREGAVNFIFLEFGVEFCEWRLYDRAIKKLVCWTLEDGWVPDPMLPVAQGADTWCRLLGETEWHADHLAGFLSQFRRSAKPARLAELSRLSEGTLRERCENLADAIAEMRPFIVRGFKPEKMIVDFGPGLAVAWDWSVVRGMADLCAGRDSASVRGAMHSRALEVGVSLNHRGYLCDMYRPWVTLDPGGIEVRTGHLAENCYLLESFHDRLFSFYDRIDTSRFGQQARLEGWDEETADEVVAVSCQHLLTTDTDLPKEPEAPARELPRLKSSVRWQRLRAILERLGCQIGPGKGSEVTIFRDGGKKFCLGHHTANRTLMAYVVKRILKRVSISPREWNAAVYD